MQHGLSPYCEKVNNCENPPTRLCGLRKEMYAPKRAMISVRGPIGDGMLHIVRPRLEFDRITPCDTRRK